MISMQFSPNMKAVRREVYRFGFKITVHVVESHPNKNNSGRKRFRNLGVNTAKLSGDFRERDAPVMLLSMTFPLLFKGRENSWF